MSARSFVDMGRPPSWLETLLAPAPGTCGYQRFTPYGVSHHEATCPACQHAKQRLREAQYGNPFTRPLGPR